MRLPLRHVLAVLVLPVTVVVLVPWWIAHVFRIHPGWPSSALELTLAAAGTLSLGLGLTLFGTSLRQFISRGQGTLAPWDPPQRLVVSGPYRYVRNPMISGVIFTLFGEALVMRSVPHAVWAAAFLAINAAYIPIVEEPRLERRFGAD